MATVSNTPVKTEVKTSVPQSWPLDNLRREVDRLFDQFDRGFLHNPFRRSLFDSPFAYLDVATSVPAIDIAEKDGAYEITAELTGMDEKDIEVTASDGQLVIKGEKKEKKEEEKQDFYLSERRYGSFERRFGVPDGVDANKISAKFQKGALTVTLPKNAAAKSPQKKIAIKPA